MRTVSWSSVLSFGANDCLTERTQAAITQPEVIKDFLCPVDTSARDTIRFGRLLLSDLIESEGQSQKLIIITGPTYTTSTIQSKACAEWINSKNTHTDPPTSLLALKSLYSHPVTRLTVLMNANVSHVKSLNQSRSPSRAVSSGSDGLSTHGSSAAVQPYYLARGLVNTRMQLMQLCKSGVMLAGHMDDPIALVYFNDLFVMGLVPRSSGRTMIDVASDGSYPVGFRSDLRDMRQVQRDCLIGAKLSRSHLTIMNLGQVGVMNTTGNSHTFVVLELKELMQSENVESKVLKELEPGLKILVDIGKVNGSNHKSRLEMVKLVIHSVLLRLRLIGFIIDSGDRYTSEDIFYSKDSTEEVPCDENECPVVYSAISEELSPSPKRNSVSNFMMKSLISSYSKLSTFKLKPQVNNVGFELFLHTDKLINEIDRLIG